MYRIRNKIWQNKCINSYKNEKYALSFSMLMSSKEKHYFTFSRLDVKS